MSASGRRLMKEAAELSNSPSPHFQAHPVGDNLFDWHFTLSGPPSPSPYAEGIYHGRIVLQSSYPLRPPSFRFLTPSGRFEVNREICLSISGHHEEHWQPAWGIRTALIAIRSFMDGDAKGQVGGLDVDNNVRREYARRSRQWKCDVCHGGKTNGMVLDEWRAYCREKGVLDDDGAADGDEGGKSKKTATPDGDDTLAENKKLAPPSPSASLAGDDLSPATAGHLPSSTSCQPKQPHATPPCLPPSPSDLVQQQQLQQQQQQHRETSSATATNPTASAAANSTATRTATSSSSSAQNDAWLDRAILGVILALTFMILKRILDSFDDDYL